MKNRLLICSLFLSLAGLLSCQTELSQDFDITLSNDHLILINDSARSCALQIGDPTHVQKDDIQSLYASIGSFTINWTGSKSLRLSYIQMTLTGAAFPGGKLVLPAISGDRLNYAWSGTTTIQDIPAGATQASTSNCSFIVGGVQVADKTQYWSGDGTFLVYGTTTDSDGKVSPAFASVPFTYEYAGNGQ